MVDLVSIFGGPFVPPEKRVDPPEEQLREAIAQAGMTPPAEIYLDGHVHRFRSGTKGRPGHGDKTGWYIAFGDGVPAGRFGCWRAGIEVTWRADVGRTLSDAEEIIHARRIGEARKIRDADMARQQEISITTVEKIWGEATLAKNEHPYLARKGIESHGVRVTGDGRLIVPLRNADGSLASLQYISDDGSKLYHMGASVGGKFLMIGHMDEPGTIYLAEGFATAATIHEVMGRPCVASFSASNLVPVLGELREKYGALQDIVVVADNDTSGVGQRYAEQASAKFGARVVVMPEPGDANDYRLAGKDLSTLLLPAASDWLVPVDEFCQQPAPIAWLVKHWLQSSALIMVHGPSGGGKTFVVIEWCMRIASGFQDWAGNKVRNGSVVYLAGEGHHGLKSRLAAWKHDRQSGSATMWLSKEGCDLNTPEGYNRVIDNIRRLPSRPCLIVVDTLHRFLMGDENSAQDTKVMLDACAGIMREFDCSVLLVHHTGVSEEAQHRARGSSAWRGALDIEISIVPAKDGDPMQIVQRKSKDAELSQPIYAELKPVAIPGWLDEDGEQVTSAVVEIAAAPIKREIKDTLPRKRFEGAWWGAGAELLDGVPYVTRAALKKHLTVECALSDASADKAMQPTYAKGVIGPLVSDQIVEAKEHGWVVIDNTHASALIVAKMGLG